MKNKVLKKRAMLSKILINGIVSALIACLLFAGSALSEETISSSTGEQPKVSNVWFEADIRSAFDDLASQAGITILVDDYVEGFITLSLEDVSLDEAIKMMCMKGDYDYRKLEDDLFIIGSMYPDSPTFQKHAVTRRIELNYADSKNVITLLKHYELYMSAAGRTIVIRAWPKLADKIEEDMRILDKAPKQVQGQIVIAELTEEARVELGLNILEYTSNGEKGWSFTLEPGEVGLNLTDIYKFMVTLKALERKGKASLRASTIVTVPEGKETTIGLGKEMRIVIEKEQEYYRVETVRAETSLTLAIERVTSNNEIIFNFKVVAGDIAEEVPKITQIPVVYDRFAEGTAIVPNNTAFIIGGLTREIERTIRGAFPPSKSTVKEKTDLLIVVLPHIVGTPMARPGILEKELERVTEKPEVKKEFKWRLGLHTTYFWSGVNDFVEEEGYDILDPMIFYEGRLDLSPHLTLFGGAGTSEKAGNGLNMTCYGFLLTTDAVFERRRFFIGGGIANGELNLNGDEYTLNSYLLKTGLELKFGMLKLGGGYNYFPRRWKRNTGVEKNIDSSGVYVHIGLCYEVK